MTHRHTHVYLLIQSPFIAEGKVYVIYTVACTWLIYITQNRTNEDEAESRGKLIQRKPLHVRVPSFFRENSHKISIRRFGMKHINKRVLLLTLPLPRLDDTISQFIPRSCNARIYSKM